jgi:hypothetical protein
MLGLAGDDRGQDLDPAANRRTTAAAVSSQLVSRPSTVSGPFERSVGKGVIAGLPALL